MIAYKFSGEAVFVGDHAKDVVLLGGGMGRVEEVGEGLRSHVVSCSQIDRSPFCESLSMD